MQRFALAHEYLDDPTLLTRPIAQALGRRPEDDRFTLLQRDGRYEERRFHRVDLLFIGDIIRGLVQANALEAIILTGYCDKERSAVIHIPSRSFYAAGEAAELGALFVEVARPLEERPTYDMRPVELWKRRYPSSIDITA